MKKIQGKEIIKPLTSRGKNALNPQYFSNHKEGGGEEEEEMLMLIDQEDSK